MKNFILKCCLESREKERERVWNFNPEFRKQRYNELVKFQTLIQLLFKEQNKIMKIWKTSSSFRPATLKIATCPPFSIPMSNRWTDFWIISCSYPILCYEWNSRYPTIQDIHLSWIEDKKYGYSELEYE